MRWMYALLGTAAILLPVPNALRAQNQSAARQQSSEPSREAPPQIRETEVVGEPQSSEQQTEDTNRSQQQPGDQTDTEGGDESDEVVTTPTTNPTPLSEIGSTVTVITRNQIQALQQTNVAETLRYVPGLQVVRSGGPGGVTAVFIRGANSQQTKVLLDGIPINDPSNASRSFDFSNMNIDNVERIEVVRGPQSTLYGSDAMGGVINIITRKGEGPMKVTAAALGGSYGTARPSLSVRGGGQRWNYSFATSYLDTDGFSQASRRLGNHEPDGYRNATYSGRFGWSGRENLSVDYFFRYINADKDVDDFSFTTGLPFDNFIRKNRDKAFYNRIQANHQALDGVIQSVVAYNFTDYNRVDTDPGPFVPPLFQGQTKKALWRSTIQLTQWNSLLVGADYTDETAQSSFVSRLGQNDAGIYFDDRFSIGERWFTTIGFRWDDHSIAGPAHTYRLTTVYNIKKTGTAFRASIGTGFRAPSLAEVLFPFGNPNLRPETSKGWDYGVTQNLLCDKVTVSATYFRNDFQNLIIFSPTTFVLDNIGLALATGVEITSRWQANKCTSISWTYTQTDTRDRMTGLRLLRRPREKGTFGIQRKLQDGRGLISLNSQMVGDRLDTRFVLGGYTVWNASGYYDLNDRWRLVGRVDNLFDSTYQEVAGYGVPGLSAYAGGRRVW